MCLCVFMLRRSRNGGLFAVPAPHYRKSDDERDKSDGCDPRDLTRCAMRHHQWNIRTVVG
jgi:hypothetical protein